MDTVIATVLGTSLIFDYDGRESPMRMSNIRSDATDTNLRDFGHAINALQRVQADVFHKETRTEITEA